MSLRSLLASLVRRDLAPPRGADDDAGRRGYREWTDRYADLARGKRNWQLAALGLLATATLLAAGLVYVATGSRVVPYVVEVDKLGQAASFGPAEELRRTDERLLRYQLALFVRDVRSVYSDPEVEKEAISRAYAHAKDDALSFLNEHFRTSNPFLRAASGNVTVAVHSVLRLSKASWRVEWTEAQTATSLGRPTAEATWQAVLSVEVLPPQKTDALLTNPLGLYVTEIHWTEDLKETVP